jgi:predicted metalloendopeptidase
MKRTYLPLMFVLSILTMFLTVGCSDSDVPSTVDTKGWITSAYMDSTYRPGDNFFMFCNGTWYNQTVMDESSMTDVEAGLWKDANDIIHEHEDAFNNPVIKKFWADSATFNSTSESGYNAIYKLVHQFDSITTKQQAWDAIVKAMKLGYDPIVTFSPALKGGFYVAQFVDADSTSYRTNAGWSAYCFNRFNYNSEQSAEMAKKVTAAYKKLNSVAPHLNYDFENVQKHPEIYDNIISYSELQSSGADNAFYKFLISSFGFDEKDVVYNNSMSNYLSKVESLSPKEIKLIIQNAIAQDAIYLSQTDLDEYNNDFGTTKNVDSIMTQVKTDYMGYIYSYEYSTKYVSDERKAEATKICEDFRASFKQSINSLTWMSETTKAYATEKLDSMIFMVGRPNAWNFNGLPTALEGNSLAEDAIQLRKIFMNLFPPLIGKNRREGQIELICSKYPLDIVNSNYSPLTNTMNIYPAFITEPFYNASMSDAYNYATFSVIGHEMTHGFDNDGAKYNKVGDKVNWWTISDQMEFEERQKLLINCYNHLELGFGNGDPYDGIYCDGTKTLGENIADLGGLNMAHGAFVNKLQRDGYSGEELIKQEKKFYQAIANLWRRKYNTFARDYFFKIDNHATSKERVHGMLMNSDRWYELYNVKWGDKLYLKPEKRTYIW